MKTKTEHLSIRLSAEVMDWVRARQEAYSERSMLIKPSISFIIEHSLREIFAYRAALQGAPPERLFVSSSRIKNIEKNIQFMFRWNSENICYDCLICQAHFLADQTREVEDHAKYHGCNGAFLIQGVAPKEVRFL